MAGRPGFWKWPLEPGLSAFDPVVRNGKHPDDALNPPVPNIWILERERILRSDSAIPRGPFNQLDLEPGS